MPVKIIYEDEIIVRTYHPIIWFLIGIGFLLSFPIVVILAAIIFGKSDNSEDRMVTGLLFAPLYLFFISIKRAFEATFGKIETVLFTDDGVTFKKRKNEEVLKWDEIKEIRVNLSTKGDEVVDNKLTLIKSDGTQRVIQMEPYTVLGNTYKIYDTVVSNISNFSKKVVELVNGKPRSRVKRISRSGPEELIHERKPY